VLPGTIGLIQATEAIKLILKIGTPLIGKLLLYNALDMSFDYVCLRKNPDCKICGKNPEITHLIDYFDFCGVPGFDHKALDSGWEITPRELHSRLKKRDPVTLVDVREPHELEISRLPGAINIPLAMLAGRVSELKDKGEVVVICKSGNRSRQAIEILQKLGMNTVKHLAGGVNAWAKEVDPDLPIY
jgi:rhodanese-related sulfurtransferase